MSSLAEAEARAGFRAAVPTILGEPDAVYVRSEGAGEIELHYGPRPGFSPLLPWVVLFEEPNSVADGSPSRAEPVFWEGGGGLWFANSPNPGGFLWFTQGNLRLRLDTPLSRDEAIAIAASVAPAGE